MRPRTRKRKFLDNAPLPVERRGGTKENIYKGKWCPMTGKIETIPEKTRWAMATRGLTGAYIAISNALKQAVGKDKFEEFNGSLWYEAGRGAKEFADTLGLATESAGDIEGATHLLAQASMGPEFQFEVVEATKDRCVGTTTECPWHKRWKELGLDFDTCGVGHQRWVRELLKV
jgi:hypothetical protein